MMSMFRPVAPPPPPDLTGGLGRKSTWRRTTLGKVVTTTFWVLVFAFLAYVLVMSMSSMFR